MNYFKAGNIIYWCAPGDSKISLGRMISRSKSIIEILWQDNTTITTYYLITKSYENYIRNGVHPYPRQKYKELYELLNR